jgi:acyl carrier protein phosphodiesterase
MEHFDRTIIVRDNQGREASLGEIIDAAVQEERTKLVFLPKEVEEVGDYYWDRDYFPDYMELLRLTDCFNDMVQRKLRLTPPTEGETPNQT